jgi:hypothetical protein
MAKQVRKSTLKTRTFFFLARIRVAIPVVYNARHARSLSTIIAFFKSGFIDRRQIL